MTRMTCPICGKSPKNHTDSELIDHVVDCNLFVTYTRNLRLVRNEN